MEKNIILKSLKETFLLIRKHKLLVLALFVLQVLFFSVLTFLQINHQAIIAGNLESMSEYFDNLNLDDEAIAEKISQKKDVLDISQVYSNYDEIIKTLRILVIATFLVFAVLNGINWGFTDCIITKKNKKEFFAYLGKFILLAFVYGILILILILLFVGVPFNLMVEKNIGFNVIFFILGLIILYFMFISFALAGRTKLKDICKKTLQVGIKKARIIFLTYIINIAVIGLLLFLLYLAIDMAFWILLVVMIPFFFSFILTRIFLILVVNRLNKDIK